jgi:hypothetical protein
MSIEDDLDEEDDIHWREEFRAEQAERKANLARVRQQDAEHNRFLEMNPGNNRCSSGHTSMERKLSAMGREEGWLRELV